MCGIAGITGTDDAGRALVDALARLEYRGYDSAGIATHAPDGIEVRKSAGSVAALAALGSPGGERRSGIAHTRWATHGAPSTRNAHPHLSHDGTTALVHNGTVRNVARLRGELTDRGIATTSDTDSEVLVHLIAWHRAQGVDALEAVRLTLARVDGDYAVLVITADRPGTLIAAASGSPLLIGTDGRAVHVASDRAALSSGCTHCSPVLDGEVVAVTAAVPAGRTWEALTPGTTWTDKGSYPNFLLKEINEQPQTSRAAIGALFSPVAEGSAADWGSALDRSAVKRVCFLGCGSSYYAGQVAASFVENLARIPATAEPAAEFTQRDPVVEPDCLYVLISQSGETLDTLHAHRFLRRHPVQVLSIVNVRGSSLDRESDASIPLCAGAEVSVASTKVVTNMQIAGLALASWLARADYGSKSAALLELDLALPILPTILADLLAGQDAEIRALAESVHAFRSMYYLGRGPSWPVAREGAQKIKEISYIHAEAYQASELKHGPLALVDPDHVSVVVAANDAGGQQSATLIGQIQARGGAVVVFSQHQDYEFDAPTVRLPAVHPLLDHIVMGVALQVFAYHTATLLDRDVDRPRNLAKSVTVE
ncbi:glutamine--fructose-6-phosphate transaminase (isomerizing) [Actinokineospora spheciospongiae]|uniref:glutamine--fructose-6-phosphate transaminase (isomerizing) n=1 Tax=Actinokineospora spheciospongiae TaxID=909613 RepID=UPI000D70A926|nr:glutamine--fructose-6-phosphate transaminase (isomerizing) [Actinokineospora spheciospongiae]PWW66832.1 glucosamine--fructose-6-phosphate aminotransferase (isomerizing) [Actinokineospora spheciospongiae]